jgi:aminoglycoside 2''-phosphotransferase
VTAATGAAPYVRRVRQVYTDLGVRTTRVVRGHGQNNAVLLVDDALVFRFPRYPAGIARLEREVAVLRGIRGRVSLATPDPVYTAFGEWAVGKVFVGYPLIPGEPLWQETLDGIGDPAVLDALGRQVGAFLRELHAVPVAELLPDEAAAFDPLAGWRDLYARIRRRLFPRMRPDARDATARHFEAFFADPAGLPAAPVLVHGDFGTGNILYDPAARAISGVIDFGGAGPGDPAVDFAALP